MSDKMEYPELGTADVQMAMMEMHQAFEEFPPDAHPICPLLSDDDDTDYALPDLPDANGTTVAEKQKRIADGFERRRITYGLSLLLVMPEAGKWINEWKERVNFFLTKCDQCARTWHRTRQQFIRAIDQYTSRDNAELLRNLQKNLEAFDEERITRGLKRAKFILERDGPMPTTKLVRIELWPCLALFESLCCMAYLNTNKANLEIFNYVFEHVQPKKPLKMVGGAIPTMTYFLFEEYPVHRAFAEAQWQRMSPESLTDEEWEWAVRSGLKSHILGHRGIQPPARLCRFWSGFLLILRAMSEKSILENLRGMEVQPNVYFLALENLGTNNVPALSMILKALRTLMERSSKAFWDAYDQVTPSMIVEEIFKSPAFRPFLSQSLEPDMMVEDHDNNGQLIPALAEWVRAFIRSLPLARRSDVCETLLRHLFETLRVDPSAAPEAKATCILAGLVTLRECLDGYLSLPSFDTGTSLIMVNQLLNRVIQYKEVIIDATRLKAADKYNVGLSQAAIAIIQSALALDAKATLMEWDAFVKEKPVQDAVNRDSGALWESFLELVWNGQTDLAKAMLRATMPLRSIERFIPKRKDQLKNEHAKFNRRFQQQSAAIGKMLGRLSDFNPADLDSFCSDPQSNTIQPIVATLIHGEEAIREAGFELIKAITGEMTPSEAVNKMLEEYFSQFLEAFTGAVNHITNAKDSNNPWSHMQHLLKCCEFVLNSLSDPSVGQLRRKTLTPAEHAIVKGWWDCEWRAVGHSFGSMRLWHVKVDKKVMEDFCRDVMELAEKLLAQDGLMASALSSPQSISATNGDDGSEGMKLVLEPPRIHSLPLVDMLQLRDKYLIAGIIEITKKLIKRLQDNGMDLPPKTVAYLNNMLKKRKMTDGRTDYPIKTNLTNEQRIELLKALGDDAAIEAQFVGGKPVKQEVKPVMKQAKLDFSKASLKDHIASLTPAFEKATERRKNALLETMKAEAPAKAPPKIDSKAADKIKEARRLEREAKAKRDAEAIARAKALRAPPKLVQGEGSGLAGVAGVRGKDHAPVLKDEIMVGSSSEDEDESDDDELITLHAAGKKNMTEAERRAHRLLAEKMRGPVKKVKIERSAKDMRARLIPPMDVLHQAILEWDIFHEGNDPPNGYRCDHVSDTYQDPVSYKQTFFPLLINEAWRSFVTAKDETTSKPFGIKVLSRMTVDKFMEVTASVPVAINKDRQLSEGDIVIISKGQNPLQEPEELHCLSRIWKTTYKKDNVEVVYRLNAKGNQILPALLPGSEFTVVKITNMTTIEREYAALESLQYYDLMDEVLRAEPSPMLSFGEENIKNTMKNWNLNPGQAKAILNAKENDGFTLIQGPPGTGKTKTIVAMVGCLLTGVLKNPTAGVAIGRPGLGAAKNNAPAKKLLVCAPSNAAVDELVLRLKNGVKTQNGTTHQIEVVRLGRSDAINSAVKDVTLDELVKAKLEAQLNKDEGPTDREKLHQEAGEIKQKIAELRPQLEAARTIDDRQLVNKYQREFDELKRRQAHIGARIDADKASGNTFARETEIKRRQVQQEILDKAQVLCATLSGSGHEMFKNLNVEFETVIIDEAAQCVELSALIPLKYGCSKCILVGDPKQLPPTVLSQSAARYGYDQSLFVRMQKNHEKDVHLLDTQYRMHPEISSFPRAAFYEGLLQDGDDMAKSRLQPWHRSTLLGPYRFFDVRGSQERGPKNQSLVNEEELKVAMQLYRRFKADYGNVDLKGKIGIITPYKAQLYRLRSQFAQRFGDAITDEIEFNTTDAFQGRECEIIIFSCVRASPTGGIGFMTDIRRMNVGLTRARSSLWILGDSRALMQGEFWAKLIEDSKRRDRYTTGNIMGMLGQTGPQLSAAAFEALAITSSDNTRESTPSGIKREVVEVKDEDSDVQMGDRSSFRGSSPPAAAVGGSSAIGSSRPPSGRNTPSHTGNGFGSSPAPQQPQPTQYREGLPVIQGTTFTPRVKKRPYEGGGGDQPGKKQHIDPIASRAPKGPRGYNPNTNNLPPRPPPQAPSDPSAMEVLGLAPPTRAPAARQQQQQQPQFDYQPQQPPQYQPRPQQGAPPPYPGHQQQRQPPAGPSRPGPPTGPSRLGGSGTGYQQQQQQQQRPPPIVKKKAPVDPFIKRKKR
ncbi:SEN1 N terminal-domain-containing protein [Neurospora hispaniola]|uniref:SEN1 N terminal-domain-containing protein n=1 Tax=Neurospora hispaniola TaxID=588809 RepID=A0AAJ0I3T9_9PEZI|nr:SEN1 N terminal-domain-containing protein [Neurospora hispaniola]